MPKYGNFKNRPVSQKPMPADQFQTPGVKEGPYAIPDKQF